MLVQRLRNLKNPVTVKEENLNFEFPHEPTDIPDMTDRITSDLSTRPESSRRLLRSVTSLIPEDEIHQSPEKKVV